MRSGVPWRAAAPYLCFPKSLYLPPRVAAKAKDTWFWKNYDKQYRSVVSADHPVWIGYLKNVERVKVAHIEHAKGIAQMLGLEKEQKAYTEELQEYLTEHFIKDSQELDESTMHVSDFVDENAPRSVGFPGGFVYFTIWCLLHNQVVKMLFTIYIRDVDLHKSMQLSDWRYVVEESGGERGEVEIIHVAAPLLPEFPPLKLLYLFTHQRKRNEDLRIHAHKRTKCKSSSL